MGRGLRIYYNSAAYHICTRGNNKQKILSKDEDKQAFLETLAKYRERLKFKLYAFVIMPNHVHLLIQTQGKVNISKIMQAIMLSYSQKFRNKYDYTGYVWQGRFKSSVLENDQYVKTCINYIHNNPIRAELVKNIKDYQFSSHHFYHSGINPISSLIDVDRFESC